MVFRRMLASLFGPRPRRPLKRKPAGRVPHLESLEPRFNPADLFYPNISASVGGVPTQLLSLELNGDGNLDLAALTDQAVTITLGNGKGQFFQPKSIDLGSPIFFLAAADLNGDGRADLATVSWQTNAVSILINNGDGTFKAPQNLTTGGQPTSIVLNDFNADGKMDLAVSNYTGNTLSFFAGNGNGTFKAPTTIAIGESPFKLVSGDFNGDGKTDLACTLFSSGSLSVLLGNGNGTFKTAIETKIGASPLGLVAGDLNGDKKTDIVCVFDQSSTGSVFLFQSDGSFTTSTFNVGTKLSDVCLADFNGDGKLDAAIANLAANGLSVALNNGAGGFGTNQLLTLNDSQYCLTSGDFNKDGKIDLVASGAAVGATSLVLGNGNGTFQKGSSFGTGGAPYALAAGDFTGDSVIDLVTANYGSNTLSILVANADLSFQPARTNDLGAQPGNVSARDLNGDGRLDLVVPLSGTSQVALLFGNGNGTFQAPQYLDGGQNPTLAKWGFLDGDAIADLVVAHADKTLSIFYGKADGTFSAPVNWTLGDIPVSLDIADIDGDGKKDIVATASSSNTVEILFGKSGQALPDSLKITTGADPVSVLAGDFNGDGRIDIATVNQIDNSIGILLQTSARVFAASKSFAVGKGPQSMVSGDFNKDGALDLAVTNPEAGTISVLLNDRKGGLLPAVQYPAGTMAYSLLATDVNRDGIVDLVSTSYSEKTIHILLGVGDGSFRAAQLTAAGGKPQAIATGDFNRDGKLDWVTANTTDNTLSIALGLGNGTFGTPTAKTTGSSPVSVIAADFNKDGKLDLATANSGDFSLSIHLGNGDGTFQSYSAISLENAPNMLAIGDFNKDGKIDIITASHEGSGVEILLGVGDGTFQNPQSIALANGPLSVTVGDFNQDGNADLAAALPDSNQVALLLGNGNGSFKPASFLSVAAGPWSITSGDFNGDGKLDIATSHPNTNSVSVLLATGSGLFQTATSLFLGAIPYDVVAADLNRDGKADLVSANYWKGSVSVLLSKGSNGFEEAKQYNTGGSPIELAIGDFNGDQRPDIVTADTETSTVSFLANSPAGITVSATGPLVYGSSVVLTANYLSANGVAAPTGQVVFKQGATVLGSAAFALKNGEWIATLTLPKGWNAGTQADIWAQYAGDANNTAIASAHVSFDVAPKTLVLAATPAGKTYDGTTKTTALLTLSGLIGTDKVSVSYASANFVDANAAAGKTVIIDGITLTGANAANYRVEGSISSKANISQKVLTITADSKTKVYGQALPELTASFTGLAAGETASAISGLKLATTALASSKVGAYAITASGAASANYKITFVNGSLNVTKASLTILPEDKTKVYGAAMPALTATMIGLVNGDSSAAITGLKLTSTATAKSSVGDYSIKGSAAVSANYTITYLAGSLKVTKASLIVAPENKTKVYGATMPALTAKFTGLVNGDKGTTIPGIKLATSALATSNVGDYAITVVAGASSNYEITLVPGTLTVQPAKLVIAAENKTKAYGDALPTFTAKITGLVNGDKPSAITGLTFDTLATQFSHVGTYAITPVGSVAPNYAITYTPANLTITKKALAYTIGNQTRTYGTPLDLNPVVSAPNYQTSSLFTQSAFDITAFKTRFSFLIENSGVTAQLADGFTFTIQGVGANPLGATGSGLGYEGIDKSVAIKFDLFDNGGEGNNSTGLYLNGANPSTSVSSVNLTGSGIDLQASRKIVADLTYANKKLTVVLTDPSTKKTVTQTYAVDIAAQVGSSKAYLGFTAATGGSTARQTILDWTAQDGKGKALFAYSNFTGAKGLVANGNAVIKGTDLVLTDVNKAIDISTGVNGEVLSLALQSTGNLATSPAGIYALKGVAFDGSGQIGDYDLKLTDGKLTVNKAALTITADYKAKVYGQAMPPLTVTFTGLMNHETSKVVTGLKIASTATAASKVGTYTITPSAGVAANYAIKYETGSLNVTKAALTIAAENKTKLAGAANPVLTAKYTGLVNGDKATVISGLVLSTEATQASGPGLQTIVASGAVSNNYEIQFVSGTLAINQAPVLTSANSTTFTRGQQNTFTIQASGFPAASFALSKGVLPAGVILNKATGVLSGMPTAVAGTYTFIISATNGIGPIATQIFNLIIS